MLLGLYTYYADSSSSSGSKPSDVEYSSLNGHVNGNGHAGRPNGHAYTPSDADRAIGDAGEFELDELMTDDEDEEVKHGARRT